MPRKTYRPDEATYYRWRKEYGGLTIPKAKRMKELERENARLRQAVAAVPSRSSARKGLA